jgi:hypothetical protein
VGARIANRLLLLPGVVFLVGVAAFVVGSRPTSWTELGVGVVWYGVHAAHRLLAVSGAVAAAIGLALLIVSLRGRAAFRRQLLLGRARTRPDGTRALRLARRTLDRELCRPGPQLERLVDVLLGVLVDLEASALLLQPSAMVVDISLLFGGAPVAVASMPEPLYRQLLAQLRRLIAVDEGADGAGQIDLRSSTAVEELYLELRSDGQGATAASVQVLRRLDRDQLARLKRGAAGQERRRSAMIIRREELRGGPTAPFVGEDDPTDSRSGLLSGLDPSGESEVVPLIPPGTHRPVGALEITLRLVMGMVLLSTLVAFFTPALRWGWTRLSSGQLTAPWREVELQIDSAPQGGVVIIGGRRRGVTPLRTTEPCRGRRISVLVEARGHRAWQWEGRCPDVGNLKIAAALQPRAGEVR